MNSVTRPDRNSKKHSLNRGVVLLLLAMVPAMLTAGCGSIKYVTLTPTPEVGKTFKTVDINPDDYAFFTTGPDATPEAILLIGNKYLGEFDSAGWKLRDKKTTMDMLKVIGPKKTEAKKFGIPVKDNQGVVKGKLFTTFHVSKMFIDEEENTFKVATPAMLDIGIGSRKRTSCSISLCQ